MGIMLAARDGSGGISPRFRSPSRPLIRLRDPSLCKATTAWTGCREEQQLWRENGCLIGIDVAKEVHWACAMDRNARVLFSQAVGNDPAAIVSLIGKIEALEAENTRTAIDMLGGAASLLCAMFAEAGLPLVHTPGLAVNRARQGIRGGERKSDPKDAVVIAELARTRPDLRAVEPPDPLDAEIRLLVSRRRELVTEQTRRAARLRDLLSGLFPALERRIDPTTRTGLVFLSHYAAPEDIRAAGQSASPAG
ncbi:MAG: IS110 family transposase [Rhodobacteraceae bacterium]|nr:IS110 family transposase [Paracoccaceae bacterium]